MMRCKSTDKIRTSVMYFCKIAISDGNFEKKVNGNECRFSRFSDYLTSFGEPVSWITSLRSVFQSWLYSGSKHLFASQNGCFFLFLTPSKFHFGLVEKKKASCLRQDALINVPTTGFEPAHLLAPPPQDGVSTNFTTWAADCPIKNRDAKINILTKSLRRNVRKT